MGLRQIKRKERELRLLERRLKKQGRPAAVVADQNRLDAIARQYHESGYNSGKLDGLEESLTIAKEVKTVQALRKRLGDRVRRQRVKVPA